MTKRVMLSIDCLGCGCRTQATYDLDQKTKLLTEKITTTRRDKDFNTATTLTLSIVTDRCSSCFKEPNAKAKKTDE